MQDELTPKPTEGKQSGKPHAEGDNIVLLRNCIVDDQGRLTRVRWQKIEEPENHEEETPSAK